MQIHISGTYDRETFFRAVSLFSRPVLWAAALRILLALLVLIVIAIGTYGTIASGQMVLADAARLFFRDGAMLVLVYALLNPFIDPYFVARKQWQQAATLSPLAGTINSQEIILNTTGGSRTIGWEQVKRKRLSEDLIILLTADSDLTILPRSFFTSDADWQSVREWAQREVKVEKPRRKKIW